MFHFYLKLYLGFYVPPFTVTKLIDHYILLFKYSLEIKNHRHLFKVVRSQASYLFVTRFNVIISVSRLNLSPFLQYLKSYNIIISTIPHSS